MTIFYNKQIQKKFLPPKSTKNNKFQKEIICIFFRAVHYKFQSTKRKKYTDISFSNLSLSLLLSVFFFIVLIDINGIYTDCCDASDQIKTENSKKKNLSAFFRDVKFKRASIICLALIETVDNSQFFFLRNGNKKNGNSLLLCFFLAPFQQLLLPQKLKKKKKERQRAVAVPGHLMLKFKAAKTF